MTRLKKENAFFYYSVSSMGLQAAVMTSALVALRFVSPHDLGIWQSLTLVITYGDVLNLGITRGLNRELPYFMGRGETDRARALAATAQTYVLFTGAIGLVLVWGTAIFVRPMPTEWLIGLLGLGIYWFCSIYTSYLTVTFRSGIEFKRLAVVQFVQMTINLVSVILIIRWGYAGMVARFAILGLIMAALMHWVRPVRTPPRFEWPNFRLLLSTGFRFYISSYLITAAMAFDQTILLQRGSVGLVGLYTPVVAVIVIMRTIRTSVTSYVAPRIAYNFGRYNQPQRLRRGVLVVVGTSLAVTIPTAILGWLLIRPFTELMFPQYALAIPAIQIALLSGLVWALDATQMTLNTLKAWRPLYFYAVLTVLLSWLLPWSFSHLPDPLVGVVVGGLIANALEAAVGGWLIFRATAKPGKPQLTLAGGLPEIVKAE